MNSRIQPVVCLLMVAGLAACIEGDFLGSEGGEPVASPEGVWTGSGNFVGGGNLIGLIQDGHYVIVQQINDNPVRFYAGEYDPVGTGTWPATLARYTSGRVDRNIQTTLTASTTLNILAGSDREILPLAPVAELYERTSSPDMLDDIWRAQEQQPGTTINLTIAIDSNGTLSGSDTEGCQYNGVIGVSDPQYNLYRIEELTLADSLPGDCDRDDGDGARVSFAGEGYTGFATFFDNTPENRNILWLIAANEGNAIRRILFRDSAVNDGIPDNEEEPGNDGIPPGAGTPPTDDDF